MTGQDEIYLAIAIILYIISMIIIIIKYAVGDEDDIERLAAAIGIATALSLAWGLVVIIGVPWSIGYIIKYLKRKSDEKK